MKLDEDLDTMGREQLIAEARRLRAGIRAHRDSTGHALCWHHPALRGCYPSSPTRSRRSQRGRSFSEAACGTGSLWTSSCRMRPAPTRRIDRSRMTENKTIVERYLGGFRKSDHEQILSCLTEDVEWEMPGAFHLVGKQAFDKEIENDAFVGSPTITTTRMVEENDVVVVEGRVRAKRKDGGVLNAVFCDVFVMSNARIRRLTTYLAEVKSE
jgi:ketosteroid isomerase-like protein